MSGGIDSTSVCLMLKEQGYEVIGVTMRTWDTPSKFSDRNQELPNYILEARELSERIGIKHYVADVRNEFRQIIIQNFIDEYMNGRTPNPCVLCNSVFKFRVLSDWADRMGCRYIATGHYSRLEELNEHIYLIAGDDPKKDQSYFLWRVDEQLFRRCLFPLGGYTKNSVREYLYQKGFEAKSKGDESMEVCFIDGDYRDFLRQYIPDIDQRIGAGKFVNAAGVTLGEHKGFAYYTIGQRKGLNIALGKPAYVLKLNPEKNTVMLGDAEQLKTTYMLIEGLKMVDNQRFFHERDLSVRIRYRSLPVPCEVKPLNDGRWIVHFYESVSSITPGQSAVFYVGKRVVGGALIASQRGIKMYIE